jgi:hypothetical protein
MKIFERWYLWLVLKLEIRYRVIINMLKDFLLRLYFCMVKYLNFHNSSFAGRFFCCNVNGKARV